MARGFESKDVEYQQEQAQKRRPALSGVEGSRSQALTPEQRDAASGRRTLELMLARAEADLSAARSPAHRQMLERAIADLRARLDRQ